MKAMAKFCEEILKAAAQEDIFCISLQFGP